MVATVPFRVLEVARATRSFCLPLFRRFAQRRCFGAQRRASFDPAFHAAGRPALVTECRVSPCYRVIGRLFDCSHLLIEAAALRVTRVTTGPLEFRRAEIPCSGGSNREDDGPCVRTLRLLCLFNSSVRAGREDRCMFLTVRSAVAGSLLSCAGNGSRGVCRRIRSADG